MPLLAADLLAGLFFQLHGQAQGLDDFCEGGEVAHKGLLGVVEPPGPCPCLHC